MNHKVGVLGRREFHEINSTHPYHLAGVLSKPCHRKIETRVQSRDDDEWRKLRIVLRATEAVGI